MISKAVLITLIGASIVGCSSGPDELSAKDDAAFKQSLATGKEKLDPNTLPPEVRDRVKGIMEAQKSPQSK